MATKRNWRPAATTILFNTTDRTVLMLQRGSTARFMPNLFVFPGGVLEQEDGDFPKEKTNVDSILTTTNVEGFESDYAFRIAALRELFEETGLLLVQQEGQNRVLTTLEDENLKGFRDQVREKPQIFRRLPEGMKLDVGSLYPWSEWLTPPTLPTRFDTLFFVFRVDSELPVDLCNKEMSDWIWAAPEFLIGSESRIEVAPPQFYELYRLSRTPSSCLAEMMVPTRILPQPIFLEDVPGVEYSILPGDILYDDSEDAEPIRIMTAEEVKRAGTPDSVIHRVISEVPGFKNNRILLKNTEKAPHKIKLLSKVSKSRL